MMKEIVILLDLLFITIKSGIGDSSEVKVELLSPVERGIPSPNVLDHLIVNPEVTSPSIEAVFIECTVGELITGKEICSCLGMYCQQGEICTKGSCKQENGGDSIESIDDNTESGDENRKLGDDNKETGEDNTESGSDNTESGDDNKELEGNNTENRGDSSESGGEYTESGDDNTDLGDNDTETGDDNAESGNYDTKSGDDGTESGGNSADQLVSGESAELLDEEIDDITIEVIDGGWSDWGPCMCQYRERIKIRNCTNPSPSLKGNMCAGPSTKKCDKLDICLIIVDNDESASIGKDSNIESGGDSSESGDDNTELGDNNTESEDDSTPSEEQYIESGDNDKEIGEDTTESGGNSTGHPFWMEWERWSTCFKLSGKEFKKRIRSCGSRRYGGEPCPNKLRFPKGYMQLISCSQKNERESEGDGIKSRGNSTKSGNKVTQSGHNSKESEGDGTKKLLINPKTDKERGHNSNVSDGEGKKISLGIPKIDRERGHNSKVLDGDVAKKPLGIPKVDRGFNTGQQKYMKGVDGSLCNWPFRGIQQQDDCYKAAAELDMKWGGIWDGPGDFPGCVYANDGRNAVYYNISPKPSIYANNPKYASICVGSENERESEGDGTESKGNSTNSGNNVTQSGHTSKVSEGDGTKKLLVNPKIDKERGHNSNVSDGEGKKIPSGIPKIDRENEREFEGDSTKSRGNSTNSGNKVTQSGHNSKETEGDGRKKLLVNPKTDKEREHNSNVSDGEGKKIPLGIPKIDRENEREFEGDGTKSRGNSTNSGNKITQSGHNSKETEGDGRKNLLVNPKTDKEREHNSNVSDGEGGKIPLGIPKIDRENERESEGGRTESRGNSTNSGNNVTQSGHSSKVSEGDGTKQLLVNPKIDKERGHNSKVSDGDAAKKTLGIPKIDGGFDNGHHKYMKVADGSLCNWPFRGIQQQDDCYKAAAKLDLEWGGIWDGPGDFPGCVYANDGRNAVYYNISPKSSIYGNNPKYASICVICVVCLLLV